MAFNFNKFFGYENSINQHPEQVLIYGFGIIIFGLLGLTFLAFILRKIKLIAIIDHLIAPLIISLLLCLVVAILPTLVLYLLASDVSGVKLVYCWITIFTGMTFFCFSNYQTIRNWANLWTRK